MKKNKTFIILAVAVVMLLTTYYSLLTTFAAPTIGDSATKATLGNDIIGGSKYIYNVSGVSIGTTTTSTASLVFGANGQIKFADGTTQSTAPGASDVSAAQISPGIFGSVVGKGNYTFQKGSNTNPVFMIDATNGRILIGSSTVSAPRSLLDIATGTVDALVVSDTGNVGIGTTTPSRRLDISGDTVPYMAFTPTATNNQWVIGSDNYGFITYDNTNLQYRMAMSKTANAGLSIGTTYYSTAAPANGLIVEGNVGIGTTTPAADLDIIGKTGNGVTALRVVSDVNSNDFVFKFQGAVDSLTNTMVMTQPGNVGIGTTTPAYKLTVNNGDVNFLGGVFNVGSPTTPILSAEDGGYVGVGILAGNGGAKLSVSGNISAGTYSATAAPANGMIISGSVGIGTSTPAQKLSVVGNIYASGDITADGSISANVNAAQVAPGIFGSTVGKGNYTFQKGANTNPIFMIDATNGRIMIGSSTVSAPRSLLDIATGTVDALVVSDTGNVGIGTAGPQSQLHIHDSNVLGANVQIQLTDGLTGSTITDGFQIIKNGVSGAFLWNRENAPMYFGTNATGRLSISAAGGFAFGSYYATDPGAGNVIISGNVGIGTTTPGAKLQISGTATEPDTGRTVDGEAMFGGASRVFVGYDTVGDYGVIGAVNTGVAWKNLVLNPIAGNVGIGTTTPAVKVDIWGTNPIVRAASLTTSQYAEYQADNHTNVMQIGVENTAGGRMGGTLANATYLGSYGNYGLTFHTNNLNRMTITNGGNVGIGTTTPSKRLTVKSSGNGDGINLLHSDDTVVGRLEVETDGDSYMYFNNGSGVNKILLYSNGNSYFNGGNVGIGTTGPGSLLHLYGASGATTEYVKFTSADGGDIRVGKQTGVNNNAIFGTWTNNDVSFYANSAVGMTLQTGGNVGIGTTTPATTLHVVGTSTFNGNIAGTLSSWINVSFSSGWSNYGGGLQTVQYKKVGDLVFLRGTATSGANLWSSFPVIFVLPSDYRPLAGSLQFPVVMANSAVGVIYITTTGNVAWQAGGVGSGVIYLDGVVFSVN